MYVSVVVATYKRPVDLRKCLVGVLAQDVRPHEVIVVRRIEDYESQTVIDEFNSKFNEAEVALFSTEPLSQGVVGAYNAGLRCARADIVAFIDDDAVPAVDWISRISTAYDDPNTGAVGGRDILYRNGKLISGSAAVVGKVQWFGRTYGYHHLGFGSAREVDVLKGVNMTFRRTAIEKNSFDIRLKGVGAQVDCELMFCLQLKRQGWKIVYDPAILVTHFTAQRHDNDQRESFNSLATKNQAHNETFAILTHLGPVRRIAFFVWAMFLGTRVLPGLLYIPRLFAIRTAHPFRRTAAAIQGRILGIKSWHRSGKPS